MLTARFVALRTLFLLLLSLPFQNELLAATVVEHFTKPGLDCTTTYKIGTQKRVRIIRQYKGCDKQEEIILRPLHPEDAVEAHAVVKRSKASLKEFMPFTVQRYGESLAAARDYLTKAYRAYRKSPRDTSLEFGIFYRARPEDPLQLVGAVGIQGYGNYCKGSVDLFYWLAKEAEGKGLALTATKAICLLWSYHGLATCFNMVIEKKNKRSYRLAKSLPGAEDIDPMGYKKENWRYPFARTYVYVVSVASVHFLPMLRLGTAS